MGSIVIVIVIIDSGRWEQVTNKGDVHQKRAVSLFGCVPGLTQPNKDTALFLAMRAHRFSLSLHCTASAGILVMARTPEEMSADQSAQNSMVNLKLGGRTCDSQLQISEFHFVLLFPGART